MQAFLYGSGTTVLYILIAAGIMMLARWRFTIPDELFRKILHFILLGAYIPLLFAFEAWWMAAAFALLLIVILLPVLSAAERLPMFSAFVNERKKGELKNSMVLAVGMMACSVTICWGCFGDRYLVLASIYAWGIGDAMAALTGKRFGRHKIRWRLADPRKSVEGSAAMFLCALVSVAAVLLRRGGVGAAACLVIALLAAAVCTVTEMCAKGGYDTILCPLAAMAVIIPLVSLWGRLA